MKRANTSSHSRSRRQLKTDEAEIWQRVTQTVTPLNKWSFDMADVPIDDAQSVTAPIALEAKKKNSTDPIKTAVKKAVVSPKPKKQLPNLDKKQQRNFTRGNVDIEARLDLHGLSVEQAHHALFGFLSSSRERGLRTVLVITGKGASPFTRHTLHARDTFHSPEREGKLRVEFTRWMNEGAFASLIVGYQPAHPRHGGGGAFYVRLRRKEGRR